MHGRTDVPAMHRAGPGQLPMGTARAGSRGRRPYVEGRREASEGRRGTSPGGVRVRGRRTREREREPGGGELGLEPFGSPSPTPVDSRAVAR